MTSPAAPLDKEWLARRAAWRAKREERRARQRLQNVDRAKAMHAARLTAEKAGEAAKRSRVTDKPAIYVGCSGWYYWHWKGQFYPEDIPSSRWFTHYASKFNTVE